MHSIHSCDCPIRFNHLISLFLLLLLSAACERSKSEQPAAAPSIQNGPIGPGDTTRSMYYEGIERTYILHIPPDYDEALASPLVLAFHGYGLDAGEMIRISGLNEQADASGFIVTYPNGTGKKMSWNGGHCCGEAANNNVDDVGFVRALIDELAVLTNIDPHRIYATGFSNGAIMVYRLACELSDQIAAIGPVAATQILEDQEACNPSRGVPVIHFHGTEDALNPYEGGSTAAGFQYVSVDDAIAFWIGKDECPGSAQRTKSGSIQHDVFAPCAQGSAVELYTVAGGEHAWPGGEAVSPQVGEPTMEINASPVMWDFFAAHPMP